MQRSAAYALSQAGCGTVPTLADIACSLHSLDSAVVCVNTIIIELLPEPAQAYWAVGCTYAPKHTGATRWYQTVLAPSSDAGWPKLDQRGKECVQQTCQ